MVHTFCLTHHHQLEYIAHMQKGAKEFLRVLQQTRDVCSALRVDAKEKSPRAGKERQHAQERSISCVSPTDLLAQSRSHLTPRIDLEIGHNPLKTTGRFSR